MILQIAFACAYNVGMSPRRPVFHLTDEQALEALAHPIRSRILDLLRIEGVATSTTLARRINESSGTTSYHLRRLAEVGLLVEDVDRGSRKERWWRASEQIIQWSAADFLGNPKAHQATVAMRRNYYAWQGRLLDQRLRDEEHWDRKWVKAANDSDDCLTLTPERADAMAKEIWAVVQKYRAEAEAETEAETEDAATVVWWQHLVPVFGEIPV